MSTKEIIAYNIKTQRKRKKYLQKEMADRLRIKLCTYQSYEEARAQAPIEVLVKLKRMYGLSSIDEFLDENIVASNDR